MEQTVWIYGGIILLLVALGVIVQFFGASDVQSRRQATFNALAVVESELPFLCQSPVGTRDTVPLTLASGSVLSGEENRVCASFEDDRRCVHAQCAIAPFTLDLSTEEIRQAYAQHTFSCSFEKTPGGIVVACKG